MKIHKLSDGRDSAGSKVHFILCHVDRESFSQGLPFELARNRNLAKQEEFSASKMSLRTGITPEFTVDVPGHRRLTARKETGRRPVAFGLEIA